MNTQELFQRRRENLNKIISQLIVENGYRTGAVLCKQHNLSASYISQLLNSHRQIGEKAAREIENKLGIPTYQLDKAESLQMDISTSVSLYEMQIIENEVFKLKKEKKVKLNRRIKIKIDSQQYFIKVLGGGYFPALHDGWYVYCDQKIEPMALDYVHVKLVNKMQLILEFISKKDDIYNFQSLNGTRRISLNYEDIEAIHTVLGIYSLNHFIA